MKVKELNEKISKYGYDVIESDRGYMLFNGDNFLIERKTLKSIINYINKYFPNEIRKERF